MKIVKMASSKKKQDEKHLKMLREMVALPLNKECFDCHQRGPTYINMTAGSFVCTSCSGILRGINPPHRVKSISMASFTPDEMEFLKCHGNEFCQKTWLGLYDSRSGPQLESREEQKVKDYMSHKYERKRWYVAPTESMKEETRRTNEAALNKQQPARPLKSLLGENAPKLQLHQNNQSPKSIRHQTASQPPPVKHIENPQPTLPSPGQHSQTSQKSTGSAAMDLLGDLGSDPFASSAPPGTTHSGDGFGDFGADFSKMNNQPSQTTPSGPPAGAQPVSQPPPTGMPLFASANPPLQPVGNQQTPAPVPNGTASTPVAAGDRYAALANLDSVFSVPPPPVTTAAPTSVDWSGGSGGSGYWGSSGQTSGTGTVSWNSSGGAPAGTGVLWNAGGQSATSTAQPSMNWNTSATTPVSTNTGFSTEPWPETGHHLGYPGNPFMNASGTHAPNPFGGSAPAPASTQVGNPFAGGGGGGGQQMFNSQPAAPASGFGQFGTTAANPPNQQQQMFGNQPAAPSGGFGQFGMQNGGFGAQPAQPTPFSAGGGFGTSQATPAFGTTGGFGGAASGSWGQPQATSVNPFMSAATQQQVPPRSNATNPFL